MRLQNYVRNEYGKCEQPLKTIQRIQNGFERLGLKVEYAPVEASESLHWGRIWIDDLQIVCEGKGISPELAKASAYAELTERISAGLFYPVFEEQVRFNLPALYNEETLQFLNYEWMDGYVFGHQRDLDEEAITIEELLARETHLTAQEVVDIKNSHLAQHWVNGFSLLKERQVKVPINFAAYIHGSNGLAAGNTLEEALIQASCEIFERFAQIRVVKSDMVVPTFDDQAIDSSLVQGMIEYYKRQNVRVMIKDLSLDDCLPTVGALFINDNLPKDRLEHRMLIPGASFFNHEGLIRCFTEGIQGRQTLSSARSQLNRSVIPKDRVDNYYMLMRCGVAPIDLSFLENGQQRVYHPWQSQDLIQEIEAIKRICRFFNTDCILVDHRHPILNIPVVRVIIPKISDFLPFLSKDILVSKKTRPSSAWKGESFKRIMKSFFS